MRIPGGPQIEERWDVAASLSLDVVAETAHQARVQLLDANVVVTGARALEIATLFGDVRLR